MLKVYASFVSLLLLSGVAFAADDHPAAKPVDCDPILALMSIIAPDVLHADQTSAQARLDLAKLESAIHATLGISTTRQVPEYYSNFIDISSELFVADSKTIFPAELEKNFEFVLPFFDQSHPLTSFQVSVAIQTLVQLEAGVDLAAFDQKGRSAKLKKIRESLRRSSNSKNEAPHLAYSFYDTVLRTRAMDLEVQNKIEKAFDATNALLLDVIHLPKDNDGSSLPGLLNNAAEFDEHQEQLKQAVVQLKNWVYALNDGIARMNEKRIELNSTSTFKNGKGVVIEMASYASVAKLKVLEQAIATLPLSFTQAFGFDKIFENR